MMYAHDTHVCLYDMTMGWINISQGFHAFSAMSLLYILKSVQAK